MGSKTVNTFKKSDQLSAYANMPRAKVSSDLKQAGNEEDLNRTPEMGRPRLDSHAQALADEEAEE